MVTKLEKLLEAIDPSRTYDQTFARVDNAINSFSGRSAQITDWDEFTRYMAEFVSHIEAKVLQMRSSINDHDHCWGRCVQILSHTYGPSGEKAAFEMARTGAEGGLFSVLKTVALRMAEEYAENEINARVYDYLDSLSADEQLAAQDEYLEKYGHLLPSEMTEGSAARIRGSFHKVLQKHPRMLHRIRDLNG